VFLTNALTGWVPAENAKVSVFPDLQKEREDAFADALWALINTREFILNH